MLVPAALAAVVAWEVLWSGRRRAKRSEVYQMALAHARREGLPLLVVGAPDRGATRGPGCGDVCIDIQGCACPVQMRADITKRLPFRDNSAIVFVSCVLEYVDDLDAAMAELQRISGGRLYIVRVEPWTLAAYFYPGARRTLPGEVAQ